MKDDLTEARMNLIQTLKNMKNKALEGKYFVFEVEVADTSYSECGLSVSRLTNGILEEIYTPFDFTNYGDLDESDEGYYMTAKYLKNKNINEVYTTIAQEIDNVNIKLKSTGVHYEKNDETGKEEFSSSYTVTQPSSNGNSSRILLNSGIKLKDLCNLNLEQLLIGRHILRGDAVFDLDNKEMSFTSTNGKKYILKVDSSQQL